MSRGESDFLYFYLLNDSFPPPTPHRSYEWTAAAGVDRAAPTDVRSERAPGPERARRGASGRRGRAGQPGVADGGGGAGTPRRANGGPGRNVTSRELVVVVIGGTEGLPQQNGAREPGCR